MFKSLFFRSAFLLCFSLVMQCTASDDYDPISGNYLLKDGEHVLRHKTISGDLIELSDGSQFKVMGSDSEYVEEWEAGDKLLISAPFFNLTGKALFKIHNIRESESVNAFFFKPAKKKHALSQTLSHIDRDYGEIYLVDGSGNENLWKVYEGDIKKIQTWGYRRDRQTNEKIGDPILIGTNQSNNVLVKKWQSYCDDDMHILINYECLEIAPYVRARKVE